MAEVGSAFVSILPSTSGFGRKLDSELGGEVAASGKKSGHIWGKLFGAVAGLAIGAKAIGFIGDSLSEAREAQKVGAQTAAVLKSTAGAAGLTADQVGAMAGRLSNFTGVDDEAIQSGENLLLTFTNIKDFVNGQFTGTFTSATGVMVDMSAALGQDMKSSATQLGKALNDPIKGVTALSRVGVTFTEQQKEQIKTLVESGKTTQAQQLILGELTKEFGGSAAAQATASDKARVALGNLKEQIGTALIPIVDQAATAFTTKIVPAISGFVTEVQSGKGAGGILASVFSTIGSVVQNQVLPFLSMLWTQAQTQLIPALTALAQVVAANVLPVLVAVGPPLLAFGTTVLSKVIPAVSGLIEFLVKFQSVVVPVAAGVLAMVAVFKTYKAITTVITGVTKGFAVAQGILNVVLAANPIGLVVLALVGLGVALVVAYKKSETFRNIVNGAFQKVKDAASSAFGWVKSNWPLLLGILTGPIGLAVVAIVKHWDKIVSTAKAIPDQIKSAFGNAGDILRGIGQAILDGLIGGIRDRFGELQDILSSVTDKIPDWKGPLSKDRVLLKPTGQVIMDGLIEGIDSRKGKLKSSLAFVTKSISESFGDALTGQLEDAQALAVSMRSAFNALATSIGNGFKSNVFGGSVGGLLGGLGSDVANLNAVKAALPKLVALGASKEFLLQLLQSGNSGLIVSLANSPDSLAAAASLFGHREALASSLGVEAASRSSFTQATIVASKIDELRRDIQALPPAIGGAVAGALNNASASAQRNAGRRHMAVA